MKAFTTKRVIWYFLRAAIAVGAIVVCSVSYAWFRVNGANKVNSSAVTMTADEIAPLESHAGNVFSMRGNYNGETGLGADGTIDAPYFVSRVIEFEIVFEVKNSYGTKVPVTQVNSVGISMGEGTPTLTSVAATYREDTLLDTAAMNDDDKAAVFGNFTWRVALVKQPYVKGNTPVAIDNPIFVAPNYFSWSTNSSLSTYYSSVRTITVVFPIEVRLYFCSSTDLANSPELRSPFAYSGYSVEMQRYIDYSYSGAAFDFGMACSITPNVDATILV